MTSYVDTDEVYTSSVPINSTVQNIPFVTEETSLLYKTEEVKGTATAIGSLFNLVNTTIGAGILSLPFAMRACGVVLGPILLLAIAIMACYSLHLLLQSSALTKKYSYKDLAIYAFGKYAGYLFEVTIVILCVGICTVYVRIIGASLTQEISLWIGKDHPLAKDYMISGLSMAFIIFPLCILHKIEFLSYASLLAVIAIAYLVICIVVKFFISMAGPGLPISSVIYVNTNFTEILLSFPIYFFAYGCHITLLPMYRDLKNRSPTVMGWVINLSVFICFSFYALIGITGYLSFANLEKFPDNILNVFPPNDVAIVIAKVFIFIVVVLSYPLVHYAGRDSIINLFYSDKPFDLIRWLSITLVYIAVTLAFGILVPDIVLLFGLFMTTSGVLVSFIFPAIIYIRLEKKWLKRIPAIALVIISGMLGIVCFVLSVIETVNGIIAKFKKT